MPRESRETRHQRTAHILQRLANTYPLAHCELTFHNPLELLIATILSAQCTDVQVNKVTTTLFKQYRSASDYANADPANLESDIRRIGLFRNKARNIQATCTALVQHHDSQVPQTLEALTTLPGVGRKTANVVLGNAFGITSGIVVDTHVARLSNRLRLSQHTNPVHIEQDLQSLVPKPHWINLSHWLIWHGRRRCNARKPDCQNCELATFCPSHPDHRQAAAKS